MRSLRLVVLAAIVLRPATCLLAWQDAVPYGTPASTAEGVLQEMAARAGVIFAGTVVAVRQPTGESMAGDASANIVEVDFRVEQAVLGPAAASTYTVREWAGLWRDAPRFEPGQRRLMLLRAPGPGGLSSPVDGLDGAIPVTGGELFSPTTRVVRGVQARAVMADPGPVSRVDLRWLQAKVLRAGNSLESSVAHAPVALSLVAMGFALGGIPTAPGASSVDTQPELGQVLGLLAAWQGSRRASP